MTAFYVDYENVGSLGLAGLEKLTSDDRLLLFYSDHADTIKMEVVQQLMQATCKVEFLKIERGTQNALDFQLITMLYSVEKGNDFCFIISKDNGYDASIRMAHKLGLNHIQRRNSLDQAIRQRQGEKVLMVQEGKQPDTKSAIPHVTAPVSKVDPVSSPVVKEGPAFEKKEVAAAEKKETLVPEKEAVSEAKVVVSAEKETTAEPIKEPAKEAAKETTKEAAKELVSAEEAHQRIAAVLTKLKVDATAENCKVVEQALGKSKDKYEFYRYFTRRFGQKKGSEFYRSIRGGYGELSQIVTQ